MPQEYSHKGWSATDVMLTLFHNIKFFTFYQHKLYKQREQLLIYIQITQMTKVSLWVWALGSYLGSWLRAGPLLASGLLGHFTVCAQFPELCRTQIRMLFVWQQKERDCILWQPEGGRGCFPQCLWTNGGPVCPLFICVCVCAELQYTAFCLFMMEISGSPESQTQTWRQNSSRFSCCNVWMPSVIQKQWL